MVRYEVGDGTLKGLFVTANTNYLGRRPGTAASGLTSASTPTHIIPNEPTFWLPERTLYNVSVGYTFNRNWSATVFVDNLFDKKYLEASLNRFLVYPGEGTNARINLTYRF